MLSCLRVKDSDLNVAEMILGLVPKGIFLRFDAYILKEILNIAGVSLKTCDISGPGVTCALNQNELSISAVL